MTFSSWRRWALLASMMAALAGCASLEKDELSGKDAQKLYDDAKSDMESGGYERAIKALERVEGLSAGTVLSQQAQLDLAYLYWKSDEKAQALSTVERFIKLNPSSPGLDYALFLRGIINFNEDHSFLTRWSGQDLSERDQRAARDAYEAFKQLIEQFPTSKYSDDARSRMAYIANSLAAYEVHVARYYYNRGAYLAAVNRAQLTVTEFQRAPATEEALFIMVQCYDKLELPKLRDDADRVLRLNYPNSRFGAEAIAAQVKPWWKLF